MFVCEPVHKGTMDKINKTLEGLETLLASRGLTLFGVVRLGLEGDFVRFQKWLDAGAHAGMEYMSNYSEVRRDPRKLLEGAKSAVIVGLNYYQDDKLAHSKEGPVVAQYARLRDYHKILKVRGEEVLEALLSHGGADDMGRVVVDTAPVLERALAARTKSGFVGKNTLFIHPQKGSFFLLSEIITTLDLVPDEKEFVDPNSRTKSGGCGTCKRCQIKCPTSALDEAYSLDANRCISYWTIEHRGVIPREFWPHLAQYVFGCDICQIVCPYNRTASISGETAEIERVPRNPDLLEMATMDQAKYEQLFGGTPMTRAKRGGLMRNALLALYVTKDPRLSDAFAALSTSDVPAVVTDTVLAIKNDDK